MPTDGSDELIILDKPKAKAVAKGKGKPPRTDPDEEEESEGAWTVEDEEEMDGFIDDADKNDDDHDDISNLLPGRSFIAASRIPSSSISPTAEQYQMARYQNLEYHFKVISQFLIHLIIRGPAYARERKKQYYRASYEAISRKLQSQKDSLVTSSVWKPDFKTSLETYPELIISYLDEVEYGCDACHLTGRLSKFSGELQGKAYDPETFEVRQRDISNVVFADPLSRIWTMRRPIRIAKKRRSMSESRRRLEDRSSLVNSAVSELKYSTSSPIGVGRLSDP